MFKCMLALMSLTRLTSAIDQNLNGMATFFQHYFAGTENLRIISIILLLLAFILFLFLIVILYIKSLLSFIRESEVAMNSETKKATPKRQIDLDMEKELSKELERSPQKNTIKKPIVPNKERPNIIKQQEIQAPFENVLATDNTISFDKQKTQQKKQSTKTSASRGNAGLSEFDWRVGRTGELDEAAAGLPVINQPIKNGTLIDYAGLILDMLARGIDAGKITQTIRYKTKYKISSENIIQGIECIQNFISLANNGKFSLLKKVHSFDSIKEALSSFAYGNAKPCIFLMEDLVYPLVDKGTNAPIAQKRDVIFSETSNYSCTLGSMAIMYGDYDLAISAFELAIELSPKNANAWSRVADAYDQTKIESKAIWAYQNVLSYATSDLFAHQLANAHQKLAKYYESQGDLLQASNLSEQSKAYYDTISVDLPLTERERNIIDLIEENALSNIDATIDNLLNFSVIKQKNLGA